MQTPKTLRISLALVLPLFMFFMSASHSFAATFTAPMGVGSSGAEVSSLQQVLITDLDLSIPTPTGYYGTLTEGGVMKYQTAHGISDTGYVGPLTLASLNSTSGNAALIATLTAQLQALEAELAQLLGSTTPPISGGGGGGGGGGGNNTCAPGETGTYPNCVPEGGGGGSPPETCADLGETGTYPNCVPEGGGGGSPLGHLSVSGTQVLDPNGNPIILRGFNWGDWDTVESQDGTDNVAQGANIVRIPLSWYFGNGTGGTNCGTGQDSYDPNSPQTGYINPANLSILDQAVQTASSAHLWIDLMVRGGDCDFWTNPTIIPEYIQMWQFLANRYKNTPYLGTYELLSEPHPPTNLGNTAVKALYEEVIAAIKQIDPNTPFIVGGAPVYNIRDMANVYMPDQKNVIYTFDFFELWSYVLQAKNPGNMTGYPGYYADHTGDEPTSCSSYPRVGKNIYMNKAWLAELVNCAVSFSTTDNVPVWADQIGIRTETPGSTQYIDDVLDIFRNDNIGFAWWTYRNQYKKSNDIVGGGAGALYQNPDGSWSTNTNLLDTLETYLQGGTTEPGQGNDGGTEGNGSGVGPNGGNEGTITTGSDTKGSGQNPFSITGD